MPKSEAQRCPNCGGIVYWNTTKQKLVCIHCDNVYNRGAVTHTLPMDQHMVVQKTEHITNTDGFLEHAPWNINEQPEKLKLIKYSCCSCGASLIADQAAITTSCPYCDNNLLVSGIITEDNFPNYILPFAITKDDADYQLQKYFSKKWYLPTGFKLSIKHTQAMYVPYYVFDAQLEGGGDYIVKCTPRVSSKNSGPIYYGVKRIGRAFFKNIVADGSSKMPDAYMDSVFEEILTHKKAFSTEYIAGILTEVADECSAEVFERAKVRAIRTFENAIAKDVVETEKNSWDYYSLIDDVLNRKYEVTAENTSSCLVPVWIMHGTWKEQDYIFAINGRTGKCVGELPISKVKRTFTIAAAIICSVLITFLLGVLATLFVYFIPLTRTSNVVLITPFMAALVAWLCATEADDAFMSKMRPPEERKNTHDRHDKSESVEMTYRWEAHWGFSSAKSARRNLEKHNAHPDKKTIWERLP